MLAIKLLIHALAATAGTLAGLILASLLGAGCQIQTLDDPTPTTPQALAVRIVPGAGVPADCVFSALVVSSEDSPHAATLDLQEQAAAIQAAVLVLGDFQRVSGGAPLDPWATTATTLSGQAYRCGAAASLPPPPPPSPYDIGD